MAKSSRVSVASRHAMTQGTLCTSVNDAYWGRAIPRKLSHSWQDVAVVRYELQFI
ncbi:hypothetical protein PISMIDRAFT_681139, partial [Pisolithus microcarpus 441]